MIWKLSKRISKELPITSSTVRASFLFVFLLFSSIVSSQNLYKTRFDLASLDTAQKIACYDFQILNPGQIDWRLGFANIGIFYDGNTALLISDSVQVVDAIAESYALGALQSNVVTLPDSPLPYSNSVGFLRLNITANVNSEGVQVPADSSWVSIVNLCFDLLIDDIPNPNTCFQMNFLEGDLEDVVPIVDVLNELVFGSPGPELTRSGVENLIPNRSFDACFILDENTQELCNDGIDNDEDGLLDCLDVGCNSFCNEDNSTTCSDGVDNDNDGMIDCEDDECSPQFESFGFVEPNNCPELDNGEIQMTFMAVDVEISLDLSKGFEKIGEIDGRGTSNVLVDYTFEDSHIGLSATYYYRLKQLDFNADYEYSNTIAIDVNRIGEAYVKVIENPISSTFEVEIFTQNQARAELQLFDINGRLITDVFDSISKLNKGKNQIQTDASSLQNGQYLLIVKILKEQFIKKIIKL